MQLNTPNQQNEGSDGFFQIKKRVYLRWETTASAPTDVKFEWQGTVRLTSASMDGKKWAKQREETPAARR